MIHVFRYHSVVRPIRHFSSTSVALKSVLSSKFFARNSLPKLDLQSSKYILSCQPSTLEQEAPKTTAETAHIPFKVTPRVSDGQVKNVTLRKKIDGFIALTKPNLTVLVTLSSICSYALAPYPSTLQSFVWLTIGTGMCSGAANAINMAREPGFDVKMKRTSKRPVVTGLIKPDEAYKFAAVVGSLGVGVLYYGINPTVAFLGFANIVLYSWIYTSLKRKSILNTWVGALVGAIPPLMGWATATNSLSDPAAWLLALLLYAWQFPHFNALSHNIKDQYKQAGYVMTAFENPRLNARVALRYSLLMFPICFGLCYMNITDWVFAVDSSLLNTWLSITAFKFWRQQQKNYSRDNKLLVPANSEGLKMANVFAKKMFWGSVWHLPGILILTLIHKKGVWDNIFNVNN